VLMMYAAARRRVGRTKGVLNTGSWMLVASFQVPASNNLMSQAATMARAIERRRVSLSGSKTRLE